MYTKIFNEGICGVSQLIVVGVLDKDTADATTGVTFDTQIPKGFRLLRGYTIPSDDLEGPTKVSCGTDENPTYYYSDVAVTKGKGIGGDWLLREPSSRFFSAKVDAPIANGKIEFVAEVVKLEV